MTGDSPVTARAAAAIGLQRATRALRTRTVAQAGTFAASNVAMSLLGAVSTALLARHLTNREFGSFSFATAALLFATSVFDFGLFQPAGTLAARARDSETKRRVLAASLVTFAPVGVAFAGFFVLLSFFVDAWFNVEAGRALLLAAPLALVYPFVPLAQQWAQGVDRLHVYSAAAALGQLLFAVFVVGLVLAERVGVTAALFARATGFTIGSLVLIVWLRPVFRRAGRYVPLILREARAFGFRSYTGRLLGAGTYNLDVFLVGAFTDARQVGLYALALAVSIVAGLPSIGLSSALFPRFAREPWIARRWLTIGWVFSLGSALVIWVLAEPFVRIVFTERYIAAAALIGPLALAAAIRGMSSFYSSFFAAQARGREVQRIAVVLTLANLALSFSLIPAFGAAGAAWATLLSTIVEHAASVLLFRRGFGPRAAAEAV